MNMKKSFKRFWTMQKHSGGFTLVELIVVIAILAILAGIGIPAYSGYITKANKQADITLISEVAHALTLASYSGDLTTDGYIILSSVDGTTPNYNSNSEVAAAMEKVFGTGWEDTLTLSYDGWLGMSSDQDFSEAYLNSSYNGNEDALINQLGSVTNTLKDALASKPSLVGDSFGSFLDKNKVNRSDNQAVSNAAVLYAADTIGKMDAAKEAAVNAAFNSFYDPNSSNVGNVSTLTLALKQELGTFGAVAAIYAHGEAFGQYVADNGNTTLLTNFHNIDATAIADSDAALNQIAANLGTLVFAAQTDPTINPYALQYIGEGQYANDVSAYMEAMKKINTNADLFADKLDESSCYTDGTADTLLKLAVSAGAMNISCNEGEVAVWIDSGNAYNTVSGIQD